MGCGNSQPSSIDPAYRSSIRHSPGKIQSRSKRSEKRPSFLLADQLPQEYVEFDVKGNGIGSLRVIKTKAPRGRGKRRGSAPVLSAGQIAGAEKPRSRRKSKSLTRRTSFGGHMSKLALQFPTIRTSFMHVYLAFHARSLPGKKGAKELIAVERLGELIASIGAKRELPQSEINKMFGDVNLQIQKTVSFREFVVAMVGPLFLRTTLEDEEFLQVQRGFKILESAFTTIDADHGGSVDSQELKKSLFAQGGQSQEGLIAQRFADLDFKDDGEIELPAFIFGLMSWVGFQDDEDEEEEEAEAGTKAAGEN